MSIYWRETLNKSILEQSFQLGFWLRFWLGVWLGCFVANWNLFGLRGDFPYCKRFVVAGTRREPSKQSLWGKLAFDTN